jgi:hypothetical protein
VVDVLWSKTRSVEPFGKASLGRALHHHCEGTSVHAIAILCKE